MSRFFEIYVDGELYCYQEDDLPLIIGTGQGAHVRLPAGRTVTATIRLHKGGYLYLQEETGSDTILHNNQIVRGSVWIKSGDVTRIADWSLQYRISGDRVEISLAEQTGPAASSAAQSGVESPLRKKSHVQDTTLPRVEEGQGERSFHVKRNIASGISFLLLVLVALFVLTARSIEVTVDPEPDTMKLHGTVPVFRLDTHFLGIAGTYILEASKAGYQDLRTEVIVNKSGSSRYDFSMEKLPGLLEVSSTPPGAEVLLDGESLGRAPLTDLTVSSGKHTLRCVLDHYRAWQQEIVIQGQGMRQSLACELQPAWGRVFVVSDPAGAMVLEGDRKIGVTPLTVELDQGDHTLLLQEDGYVVFSLKVAVETGTSLTPPVVTLERIPVQLALRSTPAGAKVSLDGKPQGDTPLQLNLAMGRSHLITFSLVGYESIEKIVTAREGENQELAVTLQPEMAKLIVIVSPKGAQLFIDGKKQKKNSGTFKLPAQKVSVEVRAEGYRPQKKTVTLSNKTNRKLNFELQVVSGKQSGKGLTLIRIEPAAFTMGASRREPGRRANESEHQVEITIPFLLGVHEVTNGEYRRFMAQHQSGVIGGMTLDGDLQPVVNVRWQDAVRYCNWLSRQEGLQPFYREQGNSMVPVVPFSNGYRLPFEAEWALTARMAGRTRPDRYPWSGSFPPRSRNGNYADESARTIVPVIIKGYYDGFPVTAPVKSFPRNIAGLFDLGGNVSEWCHDYYSPNPAQVSGKSMDPTGPKTSRYHVLRGSSWRDGAMTELRLSYRGYSNKAKDSLGFRVARYVQ